MGQAHVTGCTHCAQNMERGGGLARPSQQNAEEDDNSLRNWKEKFPVELEPTDNMMKHRGIILCIAVAPGG